ncbi:MAG: tryptophanyl-tRNA synthetase [Fusobacteria bacterium]|nr:MAG: tryptophanyl-tRNA synthetase [Fusobacteriota bacterium]KAF0229878.1 MAG: tryptophanyl-tRNA [Fusobacteriota bacterium]
MKKIVLSGMRPTGKLHIGHLSVIDNWINLQEEFDTNFFVADYHALTTQFDDTSMLQENIRNMMIDWLAIGLDPEKSTLFIQSQIKEHAELYLLFSMITPLSWLERCPTYKGQIDQFREQQGKDITTHGFLGYPLLQGADILLYLANFVPVGEDQLPHLEITREVARRFNHIYKTDLFPEPKGLLAKVPLLLGTDGRKMSKSYNNYINIMSETDEISSKVRSMITDPKRIRKDDPGNPDVCTVYSYQKIYNHEDVVEIEQSCKAGTIGCMDCKKKLISSLDRLLGPIREKRHSIEDNKKYIDDVIEFGREKAKVKAQINIEKIKEAMNLI